MGSTKLKEAELSTVEEEQCSVEIEGSDTQEIPKAPWTNLFAKNISASNGLALNYISPRIVDGNPIVQLEQDTIDKEINKWKPALMAYFIGDTPGYNAMKRYIGQFWAQAAEPDLYYYDEG